jgi:hypothetical protein
MIIQNMSVGLGESRKRVKPNIDKIRTFVNVDVRAIRSNTVWIDRRNSVSDSRFMRATFSTHHRL